MHTFHTRTCCHTHNRNFPAFIHRYIIARYATIDTVCPRLKDASVVIIVNRIVPTTLSTTYYRELCLTFELCFNIVSHVCNCNYMIDLIIYISACDRSVMFIANYILLVYYLLLLITRVEEPIRIYAYVYISKVRFSPL